jgi:hypothetical protein
VFSLNGRVLAGPLSLAGWLAGCCCVAAEARSVASQNSRSRSLRTAALGALGHVFPYRHSLTLLLYYISLGQEKGDLVDWVEIT